MSRQGSSASTVVSEAYSKIRQFTADLTEIIQRIDNIELAKVLGERVRLRPTEGLVGQGIFGLQPHHHLRRDFNLII